MNHLFFYKFPIQITLFYLIFKLSFCKILESLILTINSTTYIIYFNTPPNFNSTPRFIFSFLLSF